ncbi:NAD(P)(+) transhydrogenase (Re/Si-specific) subunit beta [Anaerococcus sp. AGMB09787]|uniref:NAD(P)(+) transhydrogenase (Re/Si-specific) subunit beta n=1 Tax=Anaerococcus sp. AGMB09787 TaxID=2922869 RepID=UPI001FAEAF7C|nr:NAD(P)(+) transhydrogenase (Re/Si-specific) subunit beta [Anaerococcus sp. AGMB09787]
MIILGILILVILFGINSMSKVQNAKFGNRLSALAMLVAIIYTVFKFEILSEPVIWAAIIVGFVIGYYMAVKVSMIQMPQTVALLNAFGGLASAIVAIISINMEDKFVAITGMLAIFIGIVTFVGSVVAALKLAKVINGRPIIIGGHSILLNLSLIASIVISLLAIMNILPTNFSILIVSILSVVFGILFAIRVGGADMPIVISLLNSTSGVAGSISGMVIFNPLLISVGSIVGASGLILTQIMCKSMNRRLIDILIGSTSTKKPSKKTQTKASVPVVENKEIEKEIKDVFSYDNLKKVTIVPGYGMALSQAQAKVKELMEALEKKGAEVDFAIHLVAGRMPGHMNVLLAEVDIDYTKFKELEEANKNFENTDLVIVIGANDVVNPAANTAEGTPIYGMPVLDIYKAKKIFVLNFDTKSGYAGVENPLYEDENTRLILGDAKESIETLLSEIRNEKSVAVGVPPVNVDSFDYNNLKKVTIVPGYGMALSQAQAKVKELMEALEKKGAEVDFAIHPVAGRMPGHMNVLLAEVNIDYTKFKELEEANKNFESTDLVIVIGANDVVNPAANTAEGTPIYGMPVLDIYKAKKIFVLNFDTKPGYAGVENPLYEDENTRLILGDAKESIETLLSEIRNENTTPVSEVVGVASDSFDYNNLKKVTIVPGYGMALSQAQAKVKELMEALEKKGAEVDFAIHPVAGRMPGHMNVLLAEVDIDYTKFKELEEANKNFENTDLVIVIGANDVVNPAANTAEGTPIYGMPVLDIYKAKKIFVLNFDKKPGYAGVENPLYEDENTRLILGDAKESISILLDEIKNDNPNLGKNVENSNDKFSYDNLKEVTIVPGYGMALSQAQAKVKELMEALEKKGAEVDFAIHPVAGRMPGHMNVLLAEVDIDYTKFKELEEANENFKNKDLVIVIGANDVVNPAANTAEGTPIYGMPVLNVSEASKVFVLNFDTKSGYAGVDNPLYEDSKARLILGDAKESIAKLIEEING